MTKTIRIILFVLLSITAVKTLAQESVTFDINNLSNGEIDAGAGSMNLCWLLDSDIERPRTTSVEQRINEMNIGSLRFPYGHLANNYLWDTPPYGGTLEPKVASSAIPANWTWATNTDGSFIQDMDFDEFMSLSGATNTEPLVVVNVLSFKYNNGPSYATLKEVAVEWVKYAQQNNLDVAYWQIGNEMDHHQNLMTKAEYVALYVDFVIAMKAEDPSIVCGPGILSDVSYFNDIMALDASTVDFTSCHQYLFNQNWGDYAGWKDDTISGLTNMINNMQNAVNNSSKPNLPILVTESNAWGCWDENNNTALYKGLAYFDLLMEQQKYEDVKYTYMWNSHSPWGGGGVEESVANAWFNNDANELSAMGWAPFILNNTALNKNMTPNSKINGKTHSYGSYSTVTGDMVIYLMNKDDVGTSMNVTLNNYSPETSYERWLFSGTSALDKHPTFQQTGTISFTANGFNTNLPPHSLVVVKLEDLVDQVNGLAINTPHHLDNESLNQRMQVNSAEDNVEFTSITDTSPKTLWEFVDAGPNAVYIVNANSNKRLRATNDLLGDAASVELVDANFTEQSAKWTPVKVNPNNANTNYYLNNVEFNNRRLSGTIGLGDTAWVGPWVQWRINQVSLSDNDFQIDNDFHIYPNPVKDTFSIKCNSTLNDVHSIQIYNQLGQLAKTMKHNDISYDVNELKTGFYILKIKSETKSHTLKLIKN